MKTKTLITSLQNLSRNIRNFQMPSMVDAILIEDTIKHLEKQEEEIYFSATKRDKLIYENSLLVREHDLAINNPKLAISLLDLDAKCLYGNICFHQCKALQEFKNKLSTQNDSK